MDICILISVLSVMNSWILRTGSFLQHPVNLRIKTNELIFHAI